MNDFVSLEHGVSVNLVVLRVLGLWPHGSYKWDFYTIYAMCLSSVQVSFFWFEAVQFYNTLIHATDLQLFFKLMESCLGHSLISVKIYTFLFNYKEVQKLTAFFGVDILHAADVAEVSTVKDQMALLRKICKMLLVSTVIVIALWPVVPLYLGGFNKCLFITGTFNARNCQNFIKYIITYGYEALVFTSASISGFNIDMLQFALFFRTNLEFKLILRRLQRLGRRPQGFRRSFIDCIGMHHKMIKFVLDFSRYSNIIVFFQFFLSTAIVSLLAFQMIFRDSGQSAEFYTRLVSVGLYIFQLFGYCWFGTRIETKSDEMCYALFSSAWIGQSVSVMKTILMFTVYCQTPIKLSAYNLFYLSLENFIKLLKSAWSVLTIMRQATEED